MKRVPCGTGRLCSLSAVQTAAWGIVLAVAGIVSVPRLALGQWTGGPSGPIYDNGGNVGVGTTMPGILAADERG